EQRVCAAARQPHADVQPARLAVEATVAGPEIDLHGEDAIGDGNIRYGLCRSLLCTAAEHVKEFELQVIIPSGRRAVVNEFPLIREAGRLRSGRTSQDQQECKKST